MKTDRRETRAARTRYLLERLTRHIQNRRGISLDHHVVGLAGILRNTAADSLSASVDGIIVEVRRASPV